MRKRKKFPSGRLIIGFFTLITVTFLVQSCVMESEKPDGTFANNTYQFDLEDIIRRGKLVVLAENSSSSYFIYREKEMGFEYDILTEFAKEIGVELEIKIIENLDNVFEDLVEGKGDIISCNLTVNRERKKIIDYSNPILNINQVLVQRKSKNEEGSISNLLTEPAQLARKKVNVWSKSSYYDRLLNLQEEIGDTIYIKSEDGLVSAEELIELVAEGLIDYTVVEKNIAQINQRFFDNLDVSLSLSANQKIAFGLRQNNPILKAKFNNWFEKYSATPEYDFIYMKYFKLSRISSHGAKPQEKLLAGRLSMYDTFFKNAATKHGWDWRWLASLSY
ncbi:MAG: membrane-bound lytic murein transglycosylase F, partial [Psychromonas sp.]